QQQIIDFYINCPEGMVVDHIIPLQSEYVSGLHHPDNLQYLSLTENSAKQNKYPEIDDLWKEENIG
ncbi:HNH endonuclease, partial [bacterium]|nr:HNH endonuclease [bacterium]